VFLSKYPVSLVTCRLVGVKTTTTGMTRENLYKAMTRGREANTVYVAVDRPDVDKIGPRRGDDEDTTARGILCGVLQHIGAEMSYT
jgi:hypothetical protein